MSIEPVDVPLFHGNGIENTFKQGDIVFIPAETFHAVKARGSETYIAV